MPGYNYYHFWPVAVIFPCAVLPFTYVSSFLFGSESNAQIFMFSFTFLAMGMSPVNNYAKRLAYDSEEYGDMENIIYKFVLP